MRRPLLLLLLLGLTRGDDDTWSWGKQPEEAGDQLETSPKVTATVDDILQSGRTGKSLEGYEQVYSDPDVQQALTNGNETQARHFIQDRLCDLGLSSVRGLHCKN